MAPAADTEGRVQEVQNVAAVASLVHGMGLLQLMVEVTPEPLVPQPSQLRKLWSLHSSIAQRHVFCTPECNVEEQLLYNTITARMQRTVIRGDYEPAS